MASEKLSEWTDPQLGRLAWDDQDLVWVGQADFHGREIRIEIDPDRKAPTRERQLAVIETARELLPRVLEAEAKLRRQAAEQLGADFNVSPQEIDRFEQTAVLEAVFLHGSGEAHYRNDDCMPGWTITVYFNKNLSKVEAEAYER